MCLCLKKKKAKKTLINIMYTGNKQKIETNLANIDNVNISIIYFVNLINVKKKFTLLYTKQVH